MQWGVLVRWCEGGVCSCGGGMGVGKHEASLVAPAVHSLPLLSSFFDLLASFFLSIFVLVMLSFGFVSSAVYR